MSPALHHFRKEFLFLKHRWFVFLMLLGVDLAVNLEWLLPLESDAPDPTWLFFLPFAILLAGVSLMTGCPEDQPGSDQSFIGTRPLGWGHFWMGHGLTLTVLLLLPVVLQNGLYLLLSARPWPDVVRGMLERGAVLIGLAAWLVPLRALGGNRERWQMALLMAGVVGLSVRVLPIVTRLIDPPGRGFFMPFESWVPAGCALAVSLTLLAIVHRRHALSAQWRMGWAGVLTFLAVMLSLYWPLQVRQQGEQNPAWVKRMSGQLQLEISTPGNIAECLKGENGFSLYQPYLAVTDVPGIDVSLRPVKSRAIQNGKDISRPLTRYENAPCSLGARTQFVDSLVAGFFPPETLIIRGESNTMEINEDRPQWQEVPEERILAGGLASGVTENAPLSLTTDYKVQWWQREVIATMGCIPGTATQQEDGYRWRVDTVKSHALGKSGPQQGAVAIRLSVERRTHWDHHEQILYLLHSPERKVAWLVPDAVERQHTRGTHAGWERQSVTLAWKDVLNHADGEDAGVDVSKLRLLIFRARELGVTEWTWQSPELKVQFKNQSAYRSDRFVFSNLYNDRLKAYHERLAALQPPKAASSSAEVNRYLYDVLMLTWRTGVTGRRKNDAAVRGAFLPLAQHHLETLLEVPKQYWPDGDKGELTGVLLEHLGEAQRETVIDHLIDHPHLLPIVLKRGWAEAAKRLQPKIPEGDVNFTPLLLAWGDEASMERLLSGLNGDPKVIHKLASDPTWRPRLEAAVKETWHRQPLTIPGPGRGHWAIDAAADLGNAAAFDLAMRMMGYRPFQGAGGASDMPPIPHMQTAAGKRIWMSMDNTVANSKRFRHLTSADFEYLPDLFAWRLKP